MGDGLAVGLDWEYVFLKTEDAIEKKEHSCLYVVAVLLMEAAVMLVEAAIMLMEVAVMLLEEGSSLLKEAKWLSRDACLLQNAW